MKDQFDVIKERKYFTMSNNQVGFSYGVLYGTLEKQANEQGYTLGDKAEIFEEIRNSIKCVCFM
jgi:hypothetical protein